MIMANGLRSAEPRVKSCFTNAYGKHYIFNLVVKEKFDENPIFNEIAIQTLKNVMQKPE